MTLAFMTLEVLWRNALGAVPFVLAVALICRLLPCRASTRHALWLILLVSLVAPPLLSKWDYAAIWTAMRDRTAPAAVSPQPILAAAPETSDRAASGDVRADDRIVEARDVPALPLIASADERLAEHASKPASATWSAWNNETAAEAAMPDMTAATLPRFESTHRFEPSSPKSFREAGNVLSSNPFSGSSIKGSGLTMNPAASLECAEAGECVPDQSESGATANSFAGSSAALSSSPPPSAPETEWNATTTVTIEEAPLQAVAAPTTVADATPANHEPKAYEVTETEPSRSALPAPAASPRQAAQPAAWRLWLSQMLAVRDAAASVSPLPASIWIGGMAFVVFATLWRIVRFRRLLRASTPAPTEVVRMVGAASKLIGLRAPPRALMSSRRISPMVWCGRRRTLLLPSDLWAELSEAGRRAVLLHELAHLRRRDHWVCWLELAVGSIYWWHPLVWWIRSRLREEADLCCDAWVTSLLPKRRGDYARALLVTRQYIGTQRRSFAAPAVGLGATTRNARRFARRLTMVMTDRSAPRLSILGTSLVMIVAAGAWIATPLMACPPGGEESSQSAPVKARVAKPRAAQGGTSVASDPADATTYERYMGQRATPEAAAVPAPPVTVFGAFSDDRADDQVAERLNRLEHRLDELTAMIEQLTGGRGGQGGGGMGGFSGGGRGAAAGAFAPAGGGVSIAAPRGGASGMVAEKAIAPQAEWRGTISTSPNGVGAIARVAAPEASGEVFKRTYRLPAGKLQPLTDLMRRSDVPVYITPLPDGIEVQGTAHQHEIFGAFIELINPGENKKRSSLDKAVEEQVAVARAQADAARAYADAAKKAMAQNGYADLKKMYEKAAKDAGRARMSADKQAEIERLRAAIEAARISREPLRGKAQELQQKSRELYRKAQEMEKKAESLQSQAESLQDEKAQADLLAQAEAFENQAEDLESLADAQQEQADEIEDQFDAVDDDIDAMNYQIDEVMDLAAEHAAEAAAASDDAGSDDADDDSAEEATAPAPSAPPTPPAPPAAPSGPTSPA